MKNIKKRLFNQSSLNLPNIITLSRIILAILTTILLAAGVSPIIVGSLFCISAITDKIDGFLARKFNCVTNLGKSADALGDKILVTPVLVVMALQGMIPLLIPYITFFRDSIVGIVKETAGKKKGTIGASKLGKAKTATTMIGMAGILLGLPEILNLLSYALLYLGTTLCIVSGAEYVYSYKECLFDKKENNDFLEKPQKNPEFQKVSKKTYKKEYTNTLEILDEKPLKTDLKPKVLTYGPKKYKR